MAEGTFCKMEEYQYQVDAHLKWLNVAGSARWNHQFTPKSRMTHRMYGSHYQTTLDARQNTYDIALPSRITEGGYKGEVCLDFGRLSLQTGVEASLYSLSPQYPETHNLFEGINLYRPKRLPRTYDSSLCRSHASMAKNGLSSWLALQR